MEMIQQLHLAAQYLASCGISFLDKKEDDSHTNLGFSVEKGRLETWPLDSAGTLFCLNYEKFALEWTSQNELVLPLDGKTHMDIIAWVKATSKEMGLEGSYAFNLHYDLPYAMDSNLKLELVNPNQVQDLLRLRTLAQLAIAEFLEKENLTSDIRIWPHHFDTGAFTALDDGSGKSIGLGMAIPDSMVNDLYFYISGYRGHNTLNTWAFKTLSHGKWVNDGFKGAILPASGATQEMVVQFFQETLENYKR